MMGEEAREAREDGRVDVHFALGRLRLRWFGRIPPHLALGPGILCAHRRSTQYKTGRCNVGICSALAVGDGRGLCPPRL